MNKQKVILLVVALALMGGGAAVLARIKTHQHLGNPGVTFEAFGDGPRGRVLLPESVLNYESEEVPQTPLVTNTLPADTSFGQRRYVNREDPNDGLVLSVVLMGADRTSIHKPQFCIEGAGWKIDTTASKETKIPIQRPQPYELPVIKLVASATLPDAQGQPVLRRGVYVYWFVADGELSGEMTGWERMWWMAKNLLETGELQRWGYVSCFAVCLPGQEDATFERIRKFLTAAVPEFQLTPKAGEATVTRP